MVSRERLVRLAGTAAELANARRVRLVAQLLLLVGIVFVLIRLRSVWHDSHIEIARIKWGWLAASLATGVSAVVATGFIWLSVLRGLGTDTQRAWAAVYFQGQLGKYIPGSVWQYAGRGALARARGIPVRVVAKSVPIELAATTYAAAAFSILLVGWLGGAGVVAAVAVALVAASRLRAERPALRTCARVSALYAGTWLFIGASFWMTGRALVHTPAGDLPVYIGAFAAAWIVGFVAIYAPGGIGVREAILVAILGPRLGTADALLVAAVSRAVFTLADVLAAALSLLAASGPQRNAAQPAPPA